MAVSETFQLNLDDQFTGGVEAARKAWDKLGLSRDQFDKRLKGVHNQALNQQFKALKANTNATDEGGGALALLGGAMAGATAEGLRLATTVGQQVVGALGRAAVAFGQGAIDAADWGTRTRAMLTALSGGDAAKAARQIEEIRDVAKSTGATMTEATEAFLEFSRAGIPDGYARNLAKIRIDAAALGPEFASAVDSLKDMKGLAVPTVDQFRKLDKLTGGKFGEALGLDRGTVQNSQRLGEALGKIQPESFAKVFAVVGKNAGKIAKDTRPVWQSIQNDISNAFSEAFDGVDLQPLRDALGPLLAQLGPALKALAPALTSIVGYATQLVQTLMGTNWAAYWAAAQAIFAEYQPILNTMAVGLGVVLVALAAVGVAAVAIGASVLLGLGTAIDVLNSLISVVYDAGAAIFSMGAAFGTAATQAAHALISGLVGGISSGYGAIASAMTALASTALGAFKSTLGIASPSKVFAEMGGYVAEGAALGIDRGAPDVQAAADSMAPSPGGGASGGGGGGPISVVINVAAGADGSVAVEIERALRRVLLEYA